METPFISKQKPGLVRAFFPCLLFLILLVSWSLAQAQTANGSLRGDVQDSAGRRVAAASIVIEARASGLKREVKSDGKENSRTNLALPVAGIFSRR